MGALAWKVIGTAAAIGAAAVARKLVTSGWTAATGTDPPANPVDPKVSWPKAVGWAVASGALIGLARLVATRMVAAYITKSTGHQPKNLQQVQ